MAVETARASGLERNWWLRAPAVLVAPRAVFVSLRDESAEAVEARQEPMTGDRRARRHRRGARTPVARHLLNDASFSVALIPVWAFIGGLIYALAVYWLGGGLLYGAARRLGGLGNWRRSRQVLGLAATPLALALLTLWPIRIAVYGENLFRTGGNDYGRGDAGSSAASSTLLRLGAYLLLVGVRSGARLDWTRARGDGRAAALPFPALASPRTVV